MSRKNQCIIFAVTLVLAVASIYAACTEAFPQPVSITLYTFAAVGVAFTCMLWVKGIIAFRKSVLLPFINSNRVAHVLSTDTRLRTILITLPGMGLNLIYAVFNGVVGILNHSAWCGSLSAYYILLCVMRFLSVSYAKRIYAVRLPWTRAASDNRKGLHQDKNIEERSWRVYYICGIILSATSIALAGAVIMLVKGQGGKAYPGVMIYAVAAYTFYKLGMAITNRIKAGKQKSVLLSTLRNISYADALVSLLSLQTALLTAFGQGSEEKIPFMNALTGSGVCLMIFVLGIHMICRSGNSKADNKNKNQTE